MSFGYVFHAINYFNRSEFDSSRLTGIHVVLYLFFFYDCLRISSIDGVWYDFDLACSVYFTQF